MNYIQIKKYLSGIGISNINLNLENIKKVSIKLNNPYESFKTIHVAGTNGKGSTSKILYDILSELGFKVGLYTSPHLIEPTERIRCNLNKGLLQDFEKVEKIFGSEIPACARMTDSLGDKNDDKNPVSLRGATSDETISKQDFALYFSKIKKVSDQENVPLTYFEYITLMAFLYFKDKKVDYAVIETGLGGRLDATNIIEDKLAVITNISIDHEEYLGNNLLDIAKEKFGIIKQNNKVVSAITQSNLIEELKKTCKSNNSELFMFDKNKQCKNIYCLSKDSIIPTTQEPETKSVILVQAEIHEQGYYFDYTGKNLKTEKIFIPALAEYQVNNAGLALKTIEVLLCENDTKTVFEQSIKKSLSQFSWPGRMEQIRLKNKILIFEGAHNSTGILELKKILKNEKRKILLLVGILNNRPYKEILKNTAIFANEIIINSSFNKNACNAELLKKQAEKYCNNVKIIEELEKMLAFVLECKQEIIYITGSLYFIGKIKEYLNKENC